MTKAKLPTNSFFGNFQTSDDDTSPKSDINDELEEDEKIEDDKEDNRDTEEKEDLEDNKEESTDEDSEELESEDDPFIATINHLAERGVLAFDEDKEYESEGEELLEEVFQETLNKRFQEEFVDTIPEDYQSIIKHFRAGGKLEDWVDAIKPTNFDSIDITDEDNQKALIEDHLRLTGMDDDDIKEAIQDHEDSGTLEKAATKAVKYLKKNEDNRVKEYEEDIDKQIKARELQDAADLDDFKKDVLTTESLKDLKLDKADRQKLLDHITKPVNKKGESQYVLNQKSKENRLLLAYMDMKGFSVKDLEKKAETKAVSGLRKTLSKITDKNTESKGKLGRESTVSAKIPKGPWG